MADIQQVQGLLHQAIGVRDALDHQVQTLNGQIRDLEEEAQVLGLVGGLFRKLIDAEIMEVVKGVAQLQTEGLREIFHDQQLEVIPEIEEQRGKISVRFPIRDKTGGLDVLGESMDSFGGSILTMQSILLRITVMFRRGLRPLLLLDETLAPVADKYVDRAVKFLSILCERMGLDILLVTHDDAIVSMAHTAYTVTKERGEAVFREAKVKRVKK